MSFADDHVVVVRIGIGDAAAARRHAFEPALVKRLEKDKKRARPRHLLRVESTARRRETGRRRCSPARRHHHRDDRKWLGHAGDLRSHPDFHDLSLDLPETGLQRSLTGAFGDQDAGRTHQRIDDVADPQSELLHPPAHAGTDHRLVQLDLSLGQLGFGARFLGRQQR